MKPMTKRKNKELCFKIPQTNYTYGVQLVFTATHCGFLLGVLDKKILRNLLVVTLAPRMFFHTKFY
jgi:hypothetical protein